VVSGGSAGSDPSGESASGPGITPAKVWHALRRRWIVAIPLAAGLAALIGWGAESQLTPVYTARTLVHVGAHTPAVLWDNLDGNSSLANFQRTQIATVKSRLVRQAVVRDLTPAGLTMLRTKGDPVGWLEKEIQADYTVAPEILRITMKGSAPEELVQVLGAVRDTYLREVVNKDRNDRNSRREALTELAGKHETALKEAREKLGRALRKHGVHEFGELRAKYERLSTLLATLQTELLLGPLGPRVGPPGLLLPAAPEADPGMVDRALDRALEADPIGAGLRKELLDLEKKIADFERNLLRYQTDPAYVHASEELRKTQERLAKRREELRQLMEPARPRAQRPNPGAEPTEAQTRAGLLQGEIKKRENEVAALAQALEDLELMRAEINRQQQQLDEVKAKIRQLDVELQAPPRAHVIEEAVIVDTPQMARTIKLVAAPACAAFLLVVALVSWLDLRRGAIDGSSDLEAARLRVIGAVPSVRPALLPVFAPPDQPGARREHLELTDAVEMARAVIAPAVTARPGFVLAITSGGPSEGKTVLSAHLAVRFARSGLRTLVIDTDMRRPQLHQIFGLVRAPGLGEWMTGVAARTSVVRPGPVPGLDVVSAGCCDPQTVSDVLGLRFPELLAIVKGDYDVVILDTAPVLTTPEALVVSRTADGVVLSVRRDVSRISNVLACTDRLAAVGAHVLGTVVTGDAPPRYHSP
jgi:capsular exopolysaccharide synthesis family protein